MHRSWPRRAFAALMAVLSLLTFGVAGEAAHVCPVHDPALAQVVEASASAHASSAAHGEIEHHDADTGHRARHCCCTGSVCTAPAVALPARAVRLAAAQTSAPSAPQLPEYVRAAASAAYFIPFANGPPLPASPSRSA